MAVYAHNFVPGSFLLADDSLLIRLAWVTVSSLLASAIVHLLKQLFPSLSPKLTTTFVIILAIATALLSSVFYFHLQRWFINWLYPPGRFGFHTTLSLGEMIPIFLISVATVALVLFAASFISLTLFRRFTGLK